MDDKQMAMVLKAISDLTTQVKRIADAVESHQADNEMLSFPLGDFKAFDWSNVDMRVVARDDDGASVIQAPNGKMCKRRSNDKFGTEIWFSYCSGKNEDATPKYAKVIEFKQVKAPEPLGRKTEQALRAAQPSPAQPTPQPPATVAVPIAPTGPAPTQPVSDPFADWKSARARINGNVPHWMELVEGDKLDDIKARTQALIEFAAIPPEAQLQLTLLSDEHIAAIAEARKLQVALSAGLVILPPNTRSIEVGAAIATINNLIAAELRKRNASAAPTVTQSGALVTPATTATQPALGHGARSAAEMCEWFARSAKANANQRPMSDQSRNVVYIALKQACGGDTDKLHRVILALCNVTTFRDAANAQIYALQAWLKPGQGTSKPMNPSASAEAEALASTEVTTA